MDSGFLADLDAMDDAGRDALPFGVIGVDRHGTVVAFNAGQSRLSGIDPAHAVGRNFFTELAPATNVPAFYGRFAAGLRHGEDEVFNFVFDQVPPLRAQIHLRLSRRPNQVWIVVRPLALLEAHRPLEAQEVVRAKLIGRQIDHAVCAAEPIHIPGAIQPSGVLLAVRPDDLTIEACSANAADLLGRPPAALLGRRLDAVLPQPILDRIAQERAGDGLDGGNPLVLTVPVKHTDRRADATVHLHDGRLILELEPAADRAEDFSNLTARALQRAVATLRDTQGREALAALTVRQVRAITGYERVLIYRFDDEWNGEVIAEDRVEDWAQSFMGMHFPATDIPAQARALYTRNPCRSVAQRDYVPVPLLAADARPVDLTFARLRSLSPVHLEYHRNMGVDGSASFSILKDGRLWGLLVAHHRRPHHCPPDLRGAAAILVNAFAMRLDDVESAAFWESRQRHQEDQARLLEQMATSDDFAAALTRGAVPLHRLFGAGGAAVLHRGRLATCGEVPPEDDIRALAARLGRQGGGAIFATDRLEAVHPPMAAHRAGASGLLAAFLDPQRQDMLLWFRPEWPRTIVWSGDPENAMRREGEGEGAILLPRRNFERWVELRRGQAEPLPRWALEVAETLRHAVAEVVIRHEARIGTLAATLARVEQALHEVTHRVKNSLQVVSSLLQLQARRAGGEAQAALVTARGRVAAIAQVHRHLYTSGSLDSVPLAPYLQSLCRDLAGSQGNGCKVTVEADPEAMLATDKAVTFGLLVAELVANACRHAYAGEGGPVEVGLSPRSSGEGWRLTIADRGRGNAELLRRPPGDGLGLKLVPGLVDQLKARLVFEDRAPGVAAVVEW